MPRCRNSNGVFLYHNYCYKMTDPLFIIVDLFCGFGGTTTGFAKAKLPKSSFDLAMEAVSNSHLGGSSVAYNNEFYDICKIIACVNHDPKAIKSHWLNHPEVKHFEEDIRTLDLAGLKKIVAKYRKLYPNAKLILWASLECTNFSKAKGGQARDGDSRTLALHLFKYIKAISPDYVQIENVVEFMSWGPMVSMKFKTDEGYGHCPFEYKEVEEAVIGFDGCYELNSDGSCKFVTKLKPVFDGVPESKNNGKDWLRWCKTIDKMFYYNHWKQLNSADFGAYTSRNRLFGCFAKEGLPIVWPEPTHSKKASYGMFNHLKKWMPVKDVLNFTDEGESIFTRKKPLSDKTLERIYAGLLKYVSKGDKAFISKYYSGRPAGKVIPVDGPAGTITTASGQTLVQPSFLVQRNSDNPKSKLVDLDGPARTLTATGGNQDLVQPEFLSTYHGNGANVSDINNPAPTIPTKDSIAIIQPKYFIDKHYGSNAQNQSIDQPAGSIMPTDKHRLVECEPFIMDTQFNNGPKSVEDPAGVITANRKHSYIINPSHGGHSTSTEAPCPVIIARQDKAPLYFVQVEHGQISIAVYEGDSEICILIKEFMVIHGLVDIKMRMLRVPELLKIQGFPDNYQMVGNQSDHKKFIGNSVHPLVPKHWAEAMGSRILEILKAA